MDFAIIEAQGKQFKITPTSEIVVEHLSVEVGKKVTFDKVLMVVDGDKVEMGTPYLEGQSFEAEVREQGKGEKIYIGRFRAKSRHRRRIGFRAQTTTVTFGAKKILSQNKSTEKPEKKEVKAEKKTSPRTSTRKVAKKEDK